MERERMLWRLMAALVLLLAFLVALGYVTNAATTVTNEVSNHQAQTIAQGYEEAVARGPDNIIRHAYVTNSWALNISYSDDNGTSWDEDTVIASGWKGMTACYVDSVMVSSNNTTVIFIMTTGADNANDAYLCVRWGWTGSWEIVHVYGHATLFWFRADAAINDTDVVVMVGRYNSGLCYKIFRLQDRNLVPAESYGPAGLFGSVPVTDYGSAIVSNKTGKHWVAYVTWTGSNYRLHYRDFCATLAARYWDISNLYPTYLGGFVCYPQSDVLASVVTWYYSGGGTYGLWYNYLRPGQTTITKHSILNSATAIVYTAAGLVTDAADHAYIFYYDDTNDDVKGYWGAYDQDLILWQGSSFTAYTTPGASDQVWAYGGLSSVWPKVSGVSVGIPVLGYMDAWEFKDELGATDDYSYQVHFSATWPYIDWSPITISNLTLQSGYRAEPYCHNFTASGGNPPLVWSVTTMGDWHYGWLYIDGSGHTFGYCPNVAGTYQFRVMVNGSYSISAAAYLNLTVLSRAPALPPAPPPPWDPGESRGPDTRPIGNGAVLEVDNGARCPEDLEVEHQEGVVYIHPFTITRATVTKVLSNVTSGQLPLTYPNRSYCTYDVLSDYLYITSSSSTVHIFINHTGNGTTRFEFWYDPGVVQLADGGNYTVWSSVKCTWTRVTTWREYSIFYWAYRADERKYTVTLSLNNTQAFTWRDVRWFVGWPEDSTIDCQGILVQDLTNGIMLVRGENFDVSLGGVSMAFSLINASQIKNFRITGWDQNASETLSPPTISCVNPTHENYDDELYYMAEGKWTNDYSLPYHGIAFLSVEMEGSLDPSSVRVYDAAHAAELDSTLFSVAGSTIILNADAVGTVPVGGVLDLKVYYKAPVEDRGWTFFTPLITISGMGVSLYWIAAAFAVAAAVTAQKRLHRQDGVMTVVIVLAIFAIIGMLHYQGVFV